MTKFVIEQKKILDAGTMAGNLTSSEITIGQVDYLVFWINITSVDAVGEFFVEEYTGDAWEPLGISPALVVNLAQLRMRVQVDFLATRMRVRYARTSGTGTVTIFYSAKER